MDRLTFIRLVDDNPERFLRRLLSFEHALRVWDEQKGLCAYCGAELTETFHIDHNHRTGATRGFLCPTCNTHWVGPHDTESAVRLLAYLAQAPVATPEVAGFR